jgi:hypothetical protein
MGAVCEEVLGWGVVGAVTRLGRIVCGAHERSVRGVEERDEHKLGENTPPAEGGHAQERVWKGRWTCMVTGLIPRGACVQ